MRMIETGWSKITKPSTMHRKGTTGKGSISLAFQHISDKERFNGRSVAKLKTVLNCNYLSWNKYEGNKRAGCGKRKREIKNSAHILQQNNIPKTPSPEFYLK